MTPFPHRYTATASGPSDGDIEVTAHDVPAIASASPPEFDGRGGRWSPETLLVGAVADCFILTFRAVARASKFEWRSLVCEATGTLDRVDRVTRFTGIDLHADLTVPDGADPALANLLLEKAERQCLISNSLVAPVHLEARLSTTMPESALCIQ